MLHMKKQIRDQFCVIRMSMRNIENSRAREDAAKNRQLLKVWNNTFKWLMDNADNEYEKALALAYYGAIGNQTAELLNWEQFKRLVNDIMKGELL